MPLFFAGTAGRNRFQASATVGSRGTWTSLEGGVSLLPFTELVCNTYRDFCFPLSGSRGTPPALAVISVSGKAIQVGLALSFFSAPV